MSGVREGKRPRHAIERLASAVQGHAMSCLCACAACGQLVEIEVFVMVDCFISSFVMLYWHVYDSFMTCAVA